MMINLHNPDVFALNTFFFPIFRDAIQSNSALTKDILNWYYQLDHRAQLGLHNSILYRNKLSFVPKNTDRNIQETL